LEDRRVSGIKLYPAGHRVALFNQQDQAAKDYLEKSVPYINSVRYSNVAADSLVYLGRAALKLEVDPRVVLEVFYDPGMKATPPLREAFLAAADLALEKEDYAVAESTTQQGLIHFPEDADLLYRWARALAGSGNDQMGPTLNRALESNPHHVPSMLMLVDHSIDAEQNDQAIEVLDRILEVNPNQPEAWAYKAIMAHLDGNSELETTSRERALKHYQKNPEIDHLIGKKLSQKYRFKEGATYQEAALALEQEFRPAQLQLAQDLLRLGDEAQGWALADDIHNKDGYNITAYNLVQLKEVIDGFKSMENDDFILRMDAAEAAIFGNQVMDLLMEAKQTLQEKYEVELDHPITVEMFPNQSDFGVRTFGMPHNPGFLGVCFGDVITANSPSSAIAHSSNWKAVLWHEFCHVITLNMTHNKMPRWLSEGISVFEELERDPSWGQHMNADYRQRILRGSMTPIDELSGAFLNANTDQDMQFAYYQSSLVVAFIVEQHGHEALRQILHELGLGTPINQALATHTKALDLLDAEFRLWASQRAKDLAPTLNWDEPDPDIVRGQAIETLLKATPNNYYHLMSAAREFAAKQA
jgi:tetratricopeptide (TPR) repeat protein